MTIRDNLTKEIGNGTTSSTAEVSAAVETNACDTDYGAAVLENSQTAYDTFLRKCADNPKRSTVEKLRQRLVEDELWKRIEAADRGEKIRLLNLLKTSFPDSIYLAKADDLLARLNRPAPTPLSIPQKFPPTGAPPTISSAAPVPQEHWY